MSATATVYSMPISFRIALRVNDLDPRMTLIPASLSSAAVAASAEVWPPDASPTDASPPYP